MPVKLFRNLSLSHLEGSKFDYIEKECGIIISGNYETLTPVLADKQLARSMNVPEHTPLLRITSFPTATAASFLTIRSCSATPASIRWTITCAASRRKAR